MEKSNILERKLERAILARKQAESILEQKALELFNANQELKTLNESLEDQINTRTIELKESEIKYRTLIENVSDIIFNIDDQGYFTFINERAEELFGYSTEEIVGHHFSEFIPDDFKQKVYDFYLKMRDENLRDSSFHFPVVSKSGDIHWIGQTVKQVKEGEKRTYAAVARDISNSIKLQNEIIEARKTAERAQQAESLFLANMSHEIRTPLNAIVGMAHLLSDSELKSEQKENVEILKTSAEILQGLISDILDISKIDAGKFEINYREVDVNKILKQIQNTLELKLENKPVELICEIDEKINTYLVSDETVLNQIFLNLIGNSIKFTEKGSITIRSILLKETNGSKHVRFEIEDTGIGIKKENVAKIFSQFKQASSEIREKYGGTGLGLAITKKLLLELGGTIKISSEYEKGTKIWFDLEFEDSAKQLEKEKVTSLTDFIELCVDHPLLVVDDNIMNQNYISSLLKKWKLPHVIASNGEEAIEMAKQKKYSLILMDLQMPKVDGFEATAWIKTQPNLNDTTTIIALTASTLLSIKQQALKTGMKDFLSKPFNPTQLHKLLSKYLTSIENGDKTKGTATNNILLNQTDLDEMYEGDLDYKLIIFKTFLEITDPEFEQLDLAFASNDQEKIRSLAHKMKPTFKMVGLSDLTDKMNELEKSASTGMQIEDLKILYLSIKTNYKIALPVIQKEVNAIETKLVSQ